MCYCLSLVRDFLLLNNVIPEPIFRSKESSAADSLPLSSKVSAVRIPVFFPTCKASKYKSRED